MSRPTANRLWLNLLFLCWFTLPLPSVAENTIPPGTVLPAKLSSSLDARRSRPGQQIVAIVMQRVPLPSGRSIPAGSKILGHVLEVNPAAANSGSSIKLRFDKVRVRAAEFPILSDLRALASTMEVDEAGMPTNTGGDRGTPSSAWTTVQVGGEVVYRGGGPVMAGDRVVGEPVPDGVLVHLVSTGGSKCRGSDTASPQATWIFSSSACGAYGFPDLVIPHAGRSNPIGDIVLASRGGNLKVASGSGLLLRVLPQ